MAQILKMKDITKTFPGVKALDKVYFDLYEGETHILLGENGAGKSTLMKILSGAYQKDDGEIYIDSKKVEINSPTDAFKYGINIIYQEFQLAPNMKVYENVFLGKETINKLKFINKKEMIKKTKETMGFVGLNISPESYIKDLTVAQKQMVEIVKALVFDARVIVFDEPTATLTDKETDRLFEIMHQLENKGLGLIYISHRLEEFQEVGHRCTVLRNGKYIETVNIKETDKNKLISLMIGGELDQNYKRKNVCCHRDKALEVNNLSYGDKVKNISFSLCEQELLGVAGLVGSGRTEMAKTLIGEYPLEKGDIYLKGKKVNIKSPHDAMKQGIMYLSEDRKDEGLFLGHSVKKNITISAIKRIKNIFLLNSKKENEICFKLVKDLNIKTPNLETKTLTLSGGNQQKVVIAKALCQQPNLYIFDEPTRGIDVGAKEEIYLIIEELIKRGASVIMISSEIPELMKMSDRILVMHEGNIAAIYENNSELSKEEILAAAVGEVY